MDNNLQLEITGERYNISDGIMVVCDPECLEKIRKSSLRVSVGTHVTYDGKEYVIHGIQGPTMTLDRWGIFVKPV